MIDPMATHVILDALIPREDFETISDKSDAPGKDTIQLSDLQSGAFFYEALRKPDFQRETLEWEPSRVTGLIRTFVEDELIPAVILWQHKGLIFVIDGSHRLSALIAWVQDDYGSGDRSRKFFHNTIPEEQERVALRTRGLVQKEFGSYSDHQDAVKNPALYGPDIVKRSRQLGTLSLRIQWVRGDMSKAEDSFIRINQKAAIISPEELELIQSRYRPNTIAARAILRKGTGHEYWSSFKAPQKIKVKEIASELHQLLFLPDLRYPLTSVDLPAGGATYSATALRMVFDFVRISVDTVADKDDKDGEETVEYLFRTRKVMQTILSKDDASLGLHPAVYFYSWTGKQQPILFLTITKLVVDLERAKQFPKFTTARGELEKFLISNRALINQVVRKFGSKGSGTTHLRAFYDFLIDIFSNGTTADSALDVITKEKGFSYLQPGEEPYANPSKGALSSAVKSGIVLRDLLKSSHICPICKGHVPKQSISIDHDERKVQGGTNITKNLQVTHPYCNTGFKEKTASLKSQPRKGA
jgi:hypothetical protein